MGEKIVGILKKLAEAWKGVTAIGSIIVVVGTSAVYLDHQKAQKNTLVDRVDYLIRSDSVDKISDRALKDTILFSLRGIKRVQTEQIREQKAMKSIIIEQFSKTMNKEELIEMFNTLYSVEKKNTGTGFYQTPSPVNK
jgi:hypothetical protein